MRNMDCSSNGVQASDATDYQDLSSNLDEYSDISSNQKNTMDWNFPLIDLCENSQWLLFENEFSLNKTCISEICFIFKNKLLCEFQTEIFLQHPLYVQKLIKWLNENKETELILECLNLLVEKLIKRHYEHITGLCENLESFNASSDCNSQVTIIESSSEITNSDDYSRWGIAKFCVSLMPTILKHMSYNSDGDFSLFMSSLHLLSSIAESCNIKFYTDLVFSNHTVQNIILTEPLTSLKFLIITKQLIKLGLLNEQVKDAMYIILKQPYWIHLYPELYNQLNVKIISEESSELQIIKMVENAYTLSSTSNLDFIQYSQLLSTSLPIIWFHQNFSIINKFIADTCQYAKLIETQNKNKYSNILLKLLSFKSPQVVLHTYTILNKTVKNLLNFNLESKKVDRLIESLLSTNVIHEIICFGCSNSNKQICLLATEIMEQLLISKNRIRKDQWKCLLNHLVPIFPVLYCYADQTSTFGQIIFNLFDPDQAKEFYISKLMLLHSIILMMASKDNKSRIEANNRITWLLQTTLDKQINLPNDIFVTEIDDLNEKVEEPFGEYTEKDLDDMIDLISNKSSSHQTIKCALFKLSVILEYSNLHQYFILNGGINIILNLLSTPKLFINERGLLLSLLKLILCFTEKNKYNINEQNAIANNFEIQLQLVTVLSDFNEVPLVKQYTIKILFYCIFNQYLSHFNKIPKVIMDKICISIKINEYWKSNNNHSDNDTMLLSSEKEFKENKNYMDILILTWHMKHFDNIDLFLENGIDLPTSTHGHSFEDIFINFRKASIKWSTKKYLVDLIAAKSHAVALDVLNDLKRYIELVGYTEQFEIDEVLFENALKKFLILPPIFATDLQTLIIVLKLLRFILKKRVLIHKLNWIADVLMKSESMHHSMIDNFRDEKSNQLCNEFFVELYEVYWLCLKNYEHFSTINLTKLLFNQVITMGNEIVLIQVNMKCLALLAENSKNIDKDIMNLYLTQFISLKTFVMDNSCEKSLQRSYLSILNHILHHTILVPNICEVWNMYDWETWTWSMIHSTDPLVRALVFQFSAGLAVIDVPVSHNLIHLALNYFCESNCLENSVVAEQATIFCSNVFCNPKFKSLCHQYIIKLDFNAFVQIINMCSYYDYTKPGKKYISTSPKLVTNICCMLFNMIILTELDLHELDQNNQFVHALVMCLKKYLVPICIKKQNIMEMCGRICSILTLFVPVSNYNFVNVLASLNIIYEDINFINLDHCTTMVWRSVFKMTSLIIKCSENKQFNITNNLISALLTSTTSKNNDLCIDALNVISIVCSQLSKKFALRVCKVLVDTLLSEWHDKLKRKMLLVALSNIFLENPLTYEIAKQEHLLHFIISKLKIMQLQIPKPSAQKSKTIQNDYLEIVGFCCNIFHGCFDAREDASCELPDLIHKLWPIVVANPKADLLICSLQMLVSITTSCPSACSALTMTSSTLGVDPKTKSTSYSLLHEIISVFSNFHLHEDILNTALLLILNSCQAQECRVIITKSKLLSNIISILNLKENKRSIKIEQQCLQFLLVFTSYHEGQIHSLKVDYILDTLVNLLKSKYKNDSIAILRNLCFNAQNRLILLSSDMFLNAIKTLLEERNLTDRQYRDISLVVWSVACNNQKARLQLRHWGINRYFENSSDLLISDNETRDIINCTYQILKS